MIISPGAFFHCFEIYIFQALRGGGGGGGGGKRAKNSPKLKRTIKSIMHHISGAV